MKLFELFDGINSKKTVKGICTKIENIKKNFIFVNTENTLFAVDKVIDKGAILIVSKSLIYNKEIPCIVVNNPLDELKRIISLFYGFDKFNFKKICYVNDLFIDVKKVFTDSFSKILNEELLFIDEFESIDHIYNQMHKFIKKNTKYVVFIIHSTELQQLKDVVSFDYMIYPKSNYNSDTKTYSNISSLLSNSGLLIYNHDDFYYDFNTISNSVCFSFEDDKTYTIKNIYNHNKIVTFDLIQNNNERSEFLLCISRYDYIYCIISLLIFFENEKISLDLIKSFFSKYAI